MYHHAEFNGYPDAQRSGLLGEAPDRCQNAMASDGTTVNEAGQLVEFLRDLLGNLQR